jgi:hypothetical protein
VRDQLKRLVDIQALDLKILELTRMRDAFPARLKEQGGRVAELEHTIASQSGRVTEMVTDRRQKERTVQAEVDKVRKWESRLHEIKTHREYQALQREIEQARKNNSDAETEILDIMTAIEEAEAHIAEMKRDLEKGRLEYAEMKAETDARCAELDEKVAGLQGQRDEVAQGVDGGVLRRYDAVRRVRGGVALVAAEGGVCQGCHMNVPPQVYNLVLAGMSVETCAYCHRLLYVPGDSDDPVDSDG